MKRVPTDSKTFNILKNFDDFAQSQDSDLSDQEISEKFIAQLAEALKKNRDNQALIHGFRIQTMFAYVAAALGGCKIITEEDAGDFFVDSDDLKRPDFRILTNDGKQIFVEVKNFYSSNPLE